jgi:hypothetical protein
MISRHPYMSLMQGDRCLAPTREVDIHFVTHPRGGVDGLDPTLFPNVAVCDSKGEKEVRSLSAWLIREYGADRIITVHEKAMMLAAELRGEFGLPGLDIETTRLFRDKVRMKQAIIDAHAARVPFFVPLQSTDDLRTVDWSRGPKVIKSCFGAGAQDIHVVDTLDAADALVRRLDLTGDSYELEEFIQGSMYHCDAVIQHGEIRFAAVSEYLSKPGDFTPGGMGGSVLLDPDDLLAKRVLDLNEKVLKALGLHEGVTHLEVFHTPEDNLVFCEVAARPGGGGIDRIVERSYGINIVEASLRLQAGLDLEQEPLTEARHDIWAVAGFYPGNTPSEGVPRDRFEKLGIAEYAHSNIAGDGMGGVRHCTDYEHKYILRGADRAELDSRVSVMRKEYFTAH